MMIRPDGTRLWVTAAGSGPTVLFVHGLFSDQRSLDVPYEAAVDAGYRAVRTDLRGHGRSTRSGGAVTVEALVADLRAVLDAEGPAVVVGEDLGGVLALELAAAAPDGVAGLALWSVDPGPATPTLRAMTRALAVGPSVRPVAGALERLWMHNPQDQALAGLLRRSTSTASAAAVHEVARAATARPDLRPKLGAIDVRTQVLWGDKNPILRRRAGPELLAALPNAVGGAIAGAGHLLGLDAPVEVTTKLLAFLADIHGKET